MHCSMQYNKMVPAGEPAGWLATHAHSSRAAVQVSWTGLCGGRCFICIILPCRYIALNHDALLSSFGVRLPQFSWAFLTTLQVHCTALWIRSLLDITRKDLCLLLQNCSTCAVSPLHVGRDELYKPFLVYASQQSRVTRPATPVPEQHLCIQKRPFCYA